MLTKRIIESYVQASGTKFFTEYRDYMDEAISWVLLRNFDYYGCHTNEEICEALDMARYYGGPGCQYAGTPLVTRTPSRILIQQRVGYDI